MVLLYDIEDDGVRNRVSQACLDFGLERIQFSAFFGRLTRNKREELELRVMRELKEENARLRVIPICEADLAGMWEYDYWRRDADELAKERGAEALPTLKIVKQEGAE